MRKTILITVLLFGIFNSQAQDFRFGIKGGGNYSTLIGSDTSELESRFNLHGGVSFRIEFNEVLALQPEIIYTSKGFTDEVNGIEIDGQMDYIVAPILLDYSLSEGFSVQGGPEVGISTVDESKPKDRAEMDLGARTLAIDLVAGLQYIAPFNIYVQARYDIGLRKVIEGVNARHSMLSLSVGYMFN